MKQLPINNILVIEDNRADAQLIKEYLKDSSFKYKIFHSPSLIGGIGLIEEKPIDIVLLDLSLDDTSGFGTLTSYLNKAENIPVIVLTGNKNETVGIRSVSAGAQDFLVKGEFSQQRLIDAIKYSIQRFKSKAKLKEVNYILKIKENRLKEAQKIGKFTNWEMNIVNNEMKWSAEMFSIFGFEQPTFSPTLSEYLRYVHIEDKAQVDAFFSSAIKSGELTKIEHRILVNGRHIKYISLRAQIKYDEISNKIILLGNLQEISEIKKKPEAGNDTIILNDKPSKREETSLPSSIINTDYDYFNKIGLIAKSLNALASTKLNDEQGEILKHIVNSLQACAKSTGNLHNLIPILNRQNSVVESEFNLPEMVDNIKSIFQHHNVVSQRFVFEENYGQNEDVRAARREIQNIIINLVQEILDNTPNGEIFTVKIINRSSEAIRLEVEITYPGDTDIFSNIKNLSKQTLDIEAKDITTLLQKHGLNNLTSTYLLQSLKATIKTNQGKGTSLNKVRIYFPITKVQKKVKDGVIFSDVNILLAEDHAMNQIVMKKRLKAWSTKIKVDVVKKGVDVLLALEKKNYDLIIMNVNLPEKGGISITKKIVSQAKYNTIDIIGTSSNPSEEEKRLCLAAGMKVYLQKPFTNDGLYGSIIRLLDK